MKVAEIKAKNIINKTGIPNVDFVINPYVGCEHGCKYCYATFMKWFTGHKERWGEFVDVKVNAPELVRTSDKYSGKSILLSSVTDPYQPLEKKYKLTRRILEKLIPIQPSISILTKSPLVLRDLDLLNQFKHVEVGVSLSITDEQERERIELGAPSINERINLLKSLHKHGIKNYLFIAPIHKTSDWKKLIDLTKGFVDDYWFDKLHYKKISIDYEVIRKEIKDYCKKQKVSYRIIFDLLRA